MSFGYDPELPAGFQDADFEQRELEEAGRVYGARKKASELARESGDLKSAAVLCPHGGGYPLDSDAAENSGDPGAGEHGYRCSDCGSRLSESPFSNDGPTEVLVPCEFVR